MIRRVVSHNGLNADLFHDGSGKPRKAVIMLGGSEGGKFWSRIKQLLNPLIAEGYCVLSLAYYKEPGLPQSLEEIPLEYFGKAFAWLAEQPEVIPGQYALIGGSKGAEAALLIASKFPQVKTVVGISPSHVVWQGIPKNRFEFGKIGVSSWSYQGRGLPFVSTTLSSRDFWALLTLRLRKIGETALLNTSQVEGAIIPVEKTQGAILLISGERDQMWPSTYMAEQVIGRLDDMGFIYPYEHIALDKGHSGLIRDRECWRKVFSFLEANYGLSDHQGV